MADLIDKNALIDNIYAYPDHEHSIMEDFAERVEMQEIVDAVEVVRCKDCVYCKRFNDVYQLPKLDVLICRYCCDEDEVTENDYCSWGERKDADG